jgi:hypothetical protein
MKVTCEGDNLAFTGKFEKLAGQVLTEWHMIGITELHMVASMTDGFVIISADYRERSSSHPLVEFAELEDTNDGTIVRVDEVNERMLPTIARALIDRYGRSHVIERSRLEMVVSGVSARKLEELALNEKEAVDNLLQIMTLLAPEGFRISRTMREPGRITMLWSQSAPEDEWVKRMERLHGRAD